MKKETTGTTKTAPKKGTSKKNRLDRANTEKTVKKAKKSEDEGASEGRDLKYNYPADVKSASQKKDFRRKYRAKRDQLQKKLDALKGKKDEESIATRKKLRGEFDKWNATHLNEGHTPYPEVSAN